MSGTTPPQQIERWDVFELALEGPRTGNPFVDVELHAQFRYKNRPIEADGFYDGDGCYRIRCMPDTPGVWSYVTRSNHAELDGVAGEFSCVEPGTGNHGPVQIHNTYHFTYADGTPYRPVGTTCYAWAHQGDELEAQTLATLSESPFNKLRMCVFPKHYAFNKNEPAHHPFERSEDGGWDFTRFNPSFFRHFEQRVQQMRDLGVEADIILFHPYDRWDYATMSAEADDRYLRYVVARLAAYRNVWWSLANEYDLMQHKSIADWDRFFRIVQQSDPYQHPRSIHNCRVFYDHGKPWVTHQSIQHSDVAQTRAWRELYHKPVVIDECCYEGNIPQRWGNITAQEMVHRFWEGIVRGGYVGHGETYLHPEDVLWWSKGGILYGQSPDRIAFLRQIWEEAPAGGLDPVDGVLHNSFACAGQPGEYYLAYFGVHQPAMASLSLPEDGRYTADLIDTWEMTITPTEQTMAGTCSLDLPGKPYVAVRLRKVA